MCDLIHTHTHTHTDALVGFLNTGTALYISSVSSCGDTHHILTSPFYIEVTHTHIIYSLHLSIMRAHIHT